MTELEKAKAGKYGEIDLNLLAKEWGKANEEFLDKMFGAAKQGRKALDAFDVNFYTTPAINTVYAINAFLCIVGVKGPLIASLMAGLIREAKTLKGISPNPEVDEDAAYAFLEVLDASSTVYSMDVPCRREKRDGEN